MTGCSVQRTALRDDIRSQMSEVVRDTVREQVIVAVYDTVTITKTITITENEQGDTIFRSVVTDRDRVRDRAAVRDKEEKVTVRTDTVFVQKTDSVYVQKAGGSNISHPTSNIIPLLKWAFWIIIAVTVLIVVIKVSKILRV